MSIDGESLVLNKHVRIFFLIKYKHDIIFLTLLKINKHFKVEVNKPVQEWLSDLKETLCSTLKSTTEKGLAEIENGAKVEDLVTRFLKLICLVKTKYNFFSLRVCNVAFL